MEVKGLGRDTQKTDEMERNLSEEIAIDSGS
jgi:hypothetical protein